MSDVLVLDENLQKQVDVGIPALDIMHGEMKNLLLKAENFFDLAEAGDGNLDYALGYLDAMQELYILTYKLSFAIGVNA